MKIICYLDMDDVVADFAKQALKYVGNDCMKLKNIPRSEMTPHERAIQNKLFHIDKPVHMDQYFLFLLVTKFCLHHHHYHQSSVQHQ